MHFAHELNVNKSFLNCVRLFAFRIRTRKSVFPRRGERTVGTTATTTRKCYLHSSTQIYFLVVWNRLKIDSTRLKINGKSIEMIAWSLCGSQRHSATCLLSQYIQKMLSCHLFQFYGFSVYCSPVLLTLERDEKKIQTNAAAVHTPQRLKHSSIIVHIFFFFFFVSSLLRFLLLLLLAEFE